MNIAVLFLIFKRPAVTARVFEIIRQVRPARLYIAADGARDGQAEEAEKVLRTRQVVSKGIDWPCEVKTLFRDKNLGCRMAVSSAIDWFFEHEEEGIILEDDCLPDVTFFRFCQELLEYYRHDTRIMAITGDNFQQGNSRTNCSYYFSRYPHCWGWATWKRAWQYWDGKLSFWPKAKKQNILNYVSCGDMSFIDYWTKIFDECYNGKIDTWDYQWIFSCWMQGGLTIIPNVNLVTNVGFGLDATHTKNKDNQYANISNIRIDFPLSHQFYVLRNAKADSFFEEKFLFQIEKKECGKIFFLKKILDYFYNILKKDSEKKIIEDDEKRRLKIFPRYCQTKTKIFKKSVYINDACTFLKDIDEILEKNIYKFSTDNSFPIIIDCGANIGISVIYSKRLYPTCKIIAFEPDPVLFQLLSKNISNFSFKNVELHQSAVWVNSLGVHFHAEGGHSGQISESDSDKNVLPVPSVRLKDILDSFESIDMLKMDIEGAENEVLFDCGISLKKCKHIFVEYHSRRDKPQELHNILSMFFNMGYRYHIREAFTREHPFVDNNCMVNMDLQLNLFFYR